MGFRDALKKAKEELTRKDPGPYPGVQRPPQQQQQQQAYPPPGGGGYGYGAPGPAYHNAGQNYSYPPPAAAPQPPPQTHAQAQTQQRPGEPFRSQGDSLAARGDYNGAVTMYDSAMSMAPRDLELLLARSLANSMCAPPRLEAARRDADAAVQLVPQNWRAWLQQGEVFTAMGRRNEAEQSYLKAVEYANGLDKLTAQRALATARSSAPPQQSPPIPSISISSQQTNTQQAQPGQAQSQRPQSLQAPPPQQSSLQTPPSTHQRSASSGSLVPPPSPPGRRSSSPIPAAASSPSASNNSQSNPPPQWNTTVPATSSLEPPHATASSSQQQEDSNRRPVSRAGNANSTNFLSGLNDVLDTPPQDDPPAYTENLRDPVVLNRRMDELENNLALKKKGSLGIRAYTAPGSIDAIKLVYVGLTAAQLTTRELGTTTHIHPTFDMSTVDIYSHPGNNFIDQDAESSHYYDGKIAGTTTIVGYSEEYRAQQLAQAPLLRFVLEANTCLPLIPLSKIVDRIRKIKFQPNQEENEGLREILNISSLEAAQHGFVVGGDRQKQIVYICKALNRSRFDAPTRFPDMTKSRSVCTHFLGASRQGTATRDFLYQILLGCELLIRLRKEPITTSYSGLITDATSALLVLGSLWMGNVTVDGSTTAQAKDSAQNYVFVANRWRDYTNGLIRFAESLRWPFMDEARRVLETAFWDMVGKRLPGNNDLWDWMFGLILPGKIFRHRIMAALVYASPSLRRIGSAPFYENGLVAGGKSYWPRRTVLGRVLASTRMGQNSPSNVCGWIGPCPVPKENITGWIRLRARPTDIPTPVKAQPGQDALNDLGFDENTSGAATFSALETLLDANEWMEATAPSRNNNNNETNNNTELKALHLTLMPRDSTSAGLIRDNLPPEQYQASLDFLINGQTSVTYTLYSNPVFVTTPLCVGSHVMHRNQAQKYLRTVTGVADLKNAYPQPNELFIIDATRPGEETVARAWCAERGWNAVIRQDGCCFPCAAAITVNRTGLGCNVLILT